MKPMTLAIALLIFTAGFATAEEAATQTFTGTYDWSDGDVGPLEAVFVPDGDGSWTVTFDFNWSDQDRTWTGTAKGSLADGTEVTGTATDGNRNWVFEAKIADGVMSGSHREIREGRKPYESGSFSIER